MGFLRWRSRGRPSGRCETPDVEEIHRCGLDAEAELPGPRAGWERRIKRKFVQRYGHEVSTKTYSV